jgi:hypothetical protein
MVVVEALSSQLYPVIGQKAYLQNNPIEIAVIHKDGKCLIKKNGLFATVPYSKIKWIRNDWETYKCKCPVRLLITQGCVCGGS